MRIQVFTFFIRLSSFCFAQSKLIGFTREQNTGIKIPDVIVKSNGASNPIASNTSGDFILKFQDLKPGKNIIVRAEKDGWELVNEKEMSTLIPENPDEKPFKIILCKAGILAKAKSKYYETFELNLQKELDKQKALNKGNEKKIASLEQDFARIQNQLNNLADEYSRIDFSDASEKDLNAIKLFKEGKYDEFIALKKSIVTEAQVDKAIKSKAEATKIVANNDSTINLYLKSQKDIATTLLLQFKFDEAVKTYENLVSKDTTDFDNTFAFARLLQEQNQLDKANRFYLKALNLTKSELRTAPTQNSLGILYLSKNDYPAALNSYQKALEIYERLAKASPAEYEPDVASILNNLGNLYKAKNDYPAALNTYSKALEIRERLAKTNPAAYEPHVATTQYNLGLLYKAKNDYPAALNANRKALEIYERLPKASPAEYESPMATALNNLGVLYHEMEDYTAALNAMRKALEIYERYIKTNPAIYELDLAQIHSSLGSLYYDKKDYTAALDAFGKALEIKERLAKASPAAYESYVAGTLNGLGLVYQEKKDYSAALNAYGKAFEIYGRLAKNNPATYESELAMIQNNLGLLYQAKKDYPAALIAYGKALEIKDRLAKRNPEVYEIEFCRTIVLLGLLQKENFQENTQMIIEQYLSKAKQILLKYTEVSLAKTLLGHVNELAIFFNYREILGPIQKLEKEKETSENFNKKIKIQENIVEHYRSLVNSNDKTFAYKLGASLSSLAWYYLFDNRFSEAENAAREALTPTKYNKTADYDEKIEWANHNLALALLFQGKYLEAEKIYIALKDKPYKKATHRETFLADLDELEKAGITHPDVVKIRTILKK